jgi:predicted DNA-binding transcriptional regulator YafY
VAIKNNDQGGRRENHKYKALLVAQVLLKRTDEDHAIRTSEIIDYLEAYGINAEAHSIQRDMKMLNKIFEKDTDPKLEVQERERLNYYIEYDKSQHGYKLANRPYDFDELKLLAECIHSAKFISEKQSKDLLETVYSLCSEHQEKEIKKKVYLVGRAKGKTRNDKVMKSIKLINDAINNDWQIEFQYMKYTIQKRNEQTPRRKGIDYVLSPFKILAVDGYFYLIAYDGKKIVRYRIDRMKTVWVEEDQPREGKKEFEKIDSRTYTQKLFGMMGGEEKHVSLRFTIDLLDTVVDRLGASVASYQPDGDRHFKVSADVAVSDQFYAWVCGFRKRVAIIDPPEVVKGFQQFLSDIQGRY